MDCNFSIQNNCIDNFIKFNENDSELFSSKPETGDYPLSSAYFKEFKKTCITKQINFTHDLKKGTNIAKFIVISFAAKIQAYRRLYGQQQHFFKSTNAKLESFSQKDKNRLNLSHLKDLLGKAEDPETEKRNLYNCRVLSIILQQNLLSLIMSNSKIQDKITYMNCVLKYMSRLQNQFLVERIQSR